MTQIRLDGFQGAPGFMNVGILQGDAASLDAAVETIMTSLDTNWTDAYTSIVDECSAVWDGTWTVFDDVTGNIQGFGDGGTAWTNICNGTGTSLSRATMAKLQWKTEAIVNNRRLQGGPFWGPLSSVAFAGNGSIATSTIADIILLWGKALVAVTGGLAVWHRPVNGAGGLAAPVTSIGVKPLPAVLRSRRD